MVGNHGHLQIGVHNKGKTVSICDSIPQGTRHLHCLFFFLEKAGQINKAES